MRPSLSDPGVKRDATKVTAGMNKRYTLEAAERLSESELPLLLTWAPGDKFFPISYAERLEKETPNARLVRIPDAEDVRGPRSTRPPRRRDRDVRPTKLRQNAQAARSFSLLACFSSDRGAKVP